MRSESAALHPAESHVPACEPSLTVKAPAKINWFLRILGKREDGYHDIVSLMQCVSLCDEITLSHADSIIVESDMNIPPSENLVYKAASLLKESVSYPRGARIVLKKRIPISAGLGGGSSDAAHTLIGLNSLWRLELRHEELRSLGSRIGSDVPFFFHSPAALVEGRGERLTSVEFDAHYTLLLVKAGVDISTRWAYAAHDALFERRLTNRPVDIKLFCHALERRDFLFLARMLFNDFEDLVLKEYPVVRDMKRELLRRGAEVSLMSGSGPTVFGLFRRRETAERARASLKPAWSSIVETLIRRSPL